MEERTISHATLQMCNQQNEIHADSQMKCVFQAAA